MEVAFPYHVQFKLNITTLHKPNVEMQHKNFFEAPKLFWNV